jgi:DNA-binding transcriptional MerR regulator
MTKQKAIPDKMYFRIGETAEILDVKPYVLRYWETEFPDIKPVKSQSNQRLYKRKDVEMLLAIKHLLYDEKFTINGARDHLKEQMKSQSKTTDLFEKVSVQGKGKSENTGKVFGKLKGELEWCLAELRK